MQCVYHFTRAAVWPCLCRHTASPGYKTHTARDRGIHPAAGTMTQLETAQIMHIYRSISLAVSVSLLSGSSCLLDNVNEISVLASWLLNALSSSATFSPAITQQSLSFITPVTQHYHPPQHSHLQSHGNHYHSPHLSHNIIILRNILTCNHTAITISHHTCLSHKIIIIRNILTCNQSHGNHYHSSHLSHNIITFRNILTCQVQQSLSSHLSQLNVNETSVLASWLLTTTIVLLEYVWDYPGELVTNLDL